MSRASRARDGYVAADGTQRWTADQVLSPQALEAALAALGQGPLPPHVGDVENLRLWLLGRLTATVAEQAMHTPHVPDGPYFLAQGVVACSGRGVADSDALALETAEWLYGLAAVYDQVASGNTHVCLEQALGDVYGFLAHGLYVTSMLVVNALVNPSPYPPDAQDVGIFDWLANAEELARRFYPDQAKVYDSRIGAAVEVDGAGPDIPHTRGGVPDISG